MNSAKTIPYGGTFTDARGVSYNSARIGVPRYDKRGQRCDGYTVRRTSPRPVEIKRAERKAKLLRFAGPPLEQAL